jgi:hypothetical protein
MNSKKEGSVSTLYGFCQGIQSDVGYFLIQIHVLICQAVQIRQKVVLAKSYILNK